MKIIGISGVARSGKDTFADGLAGVIRDNHPNLRVERYAFANFLKEDLRDFILDKFQKDVYTSEEEEKDLLRPILVSYGQAKRKQTQGRHWIDQLERQLMIDPPDVAIISDLRFAEELGDELYWLKNKKGVLVHIQRFFIKNGRKCFVQPPNSDEKRNDPVLKNSADYNVVWPTSSSPEDLKEIVAENCGDFYYQNINLFL